MTSGGNDVICYQDMWMLLYCYIIHGSTLTELHSRGQTKFSLAVSQPSSYLMGSRGQSGKRGAQKNNK